MQNENEENSDLILGCWNFASGYFNPLEAKTRNKILRAAIKNNIFAFDCAYAYGNGQGEQILSSSLLQLLKEKNINIETYEKIKISTKAILKENFSILDDLESALKRLRRDSIETFFIHWPKKKFCAAKSIELLNIAKEKNKIQNVGVSNFLLPDLKEAIKGGKIDKVQLCLNLLWRRELEEIIPFCEENKIGVEIYSPLAQGILKDDSILFKNQMNLIFKKLQKPQSDKRKNHLIFLQEDLAKNLSPILQEMINASKPFSLNEIALRWIKQKLPNSKIAVGASSTNQIETSSKALKLAAQPQIEKIEELSKIAYSEVIKIFPNATNIFNHTA